MTHKMLELPYGQDALEPRMSAETLAYHHGKHLKTYLDNVNRLIVGTPYEDLPLKEIICRASGPLYNNAAQAWNHILFFKQLSPRPVSMSPMLSQTLCAAFGSIDNFKKLFCDTAISLFGSGWVWLAINNERQLHVLAEPNAGNPLTRNMNPLLCIDVWEHAYYLDYQNRRADYVTNYWHLINWEKVECRMMRDDCTLYY